MTRQVQLTATVNVTGDKQAVISGSTNLPDGTKLMISITPLAGKGIWECKTSVKNGSYTSKRMGPEFGFDVGGYTAEVLMPIPTTQPDQVRKIIGSHGEYLRGDLVKHDSFGTTVQCDKDFSIGGPDAIAEQSTRAKDQAAQERSSVQFIYSQLKRLAKDLESNRSLAIQNDAESLRQWGDFARQFRSRCSAIEKRINGINDAEPKILLSTSESNLMSMLIRANGSSNNSYSEADDRFAESMEQIKNWMGNIR